GRDPAGANPGLRETDTGTWLRQSWAETLELARRLHPRTRRAVAIIGSSAPERTWANAAREQLAPHAGSLELSYLVGLTLEQALKEVPALPQDSIVLALSFLRDASGRDFSPPVMMSRLATVARVPVYGLTDGAIGAGAVGGVVVSFEAHGKMAADLALK